MKNWRNHKIIHLILVLLVFSCTGFSVGWLGRQIVETTGIVRFSLIYWLIWIFPLLPIYNVIILGYAFIFGKFQYFRSKQIKSWQKLKRLFSKK